MKRTSLLAAKLTRKMALWFLIIYLVVLFSLTLLLIRPLDRVSNNEAVNKLSLMCDEIENVEEQVVYFVNSLTSIQELSDGLREYNRTQSSTARAEIEQALSAYSISHDKSLTMTLEDFDHNYFSAIYYRNIISPEEAAANERYQTLFSYPYGSYFSFIPKEIFHSEPSYYSFDVLEYSKILYFNTKPYVARSFFRFSIVLNHCMQLGNGFFSDFCLLSPTAGVVYESGAHPWDSVEMTGAKGRCFGKKGIYYYTKDTVSGWTIMAYAPYTSIYSSALLILGIITGLYLLSPILYGILLIPITKKMLAPLDDLNQAMQSYSAGSRQALTIATGDEIEALSRVFNNMQDRIDKQVCDIQVQERTNAVTNFKLLTTQIDPHFIYNTMNIINIMARNGDTHAVVEVNTALIRLLRERLSAKLSIMDTIENEMNSLHQYSLIMDYRYENRISLAGDVDPDVTSLRIPKNILQPLAENAFCHGFASLPEGETGHIEVLIYSVEDNIVIEVSDDGDGIEPERLALLQDNSRKIYDDKKPHIGIDNIRQRLTYIYGSNFQFEIHSTVGYGTSISITLPVEAPEVQEL